MRSKNYTCQCCGDPSYGNYCWKPECRKAYYRMVQKRLTKEKKDAAKAVKKVLKENALVPLHQLNATSGTRFEQLLGKILRGEKTLTFNR